MKKWIFSIALSLCFSFCCATYSEDTAALVTAQKQQIITPQTALTRLERGNARFASGHAIDIDYLKKARLTATGQHPFAVILSCMDSRVPPEVVFNQPIGNLFVTRTAANVINSGILGGLEFATKVSGAKLIVVMGHDSCGAIRGACENVKLGNLTSLLNKVQPAIDKTVTQYKKRECQNRQFINDAAKNNVLYVMKIIPKQSPVIRELMKTGQVEIIGAMYDLSTGRVSFFNKNTFMNKS